MIYLQKVIVGGIVILFIGMAIIPLGGGISGEKHFSTEIQLWESSSRDDNDTTPPVTTHFINGTEGENGFYISNVEVTLNATDDISGVNVTYYFVDTPPIPKMYTGSFWVTGEANHLVCYYSVDNAGNVEEWKCVNIYIDLYPPRVFLGYYGTPQGYKFIADAIDDASLVEKVEFYLDDKLMFTDFNSPYEWNSNLSGGGFSVSVIAYDRAGHRAYDEIWIKTLGDFVKGIIYGFDNQIQSQYNSQLTINLLLLQFFKRFPLLENLLNL